MTLRRCVLLSVLVLPAVAAADTVTAYQGEARALDGDALLYEEHHLLRSDGAQPRERIVMYRCPNGEAFARKQVDYATPAYTPTFRMDDARFGYVEGFARDGDEGAAFVRRTTDAQEQREDVDVGEDLVVDAGFDEFVRARWDALQAGKAVPLDFLVPSRLTSYGFKVRKLREETLYDRPVSVFQLALGGVFGWFADPIEVTYRNEDRRLMRFAGLSNIRKSPEDNLNARIVFPPAREAAADDAAWQAALDEPLRACSIGG